MAPRSHSRRTSLCRHKSRHCQRRHHVVLLFHLRHGARGASREALLADLDDEFSPGFFLRIVLRENREIEVTEKLLELGLQRPESDKLMSQVLEHWGSVTVTISMMLSAVQNHECGDKMTQLLLSQNEHIAKPTEEIITVAVSNERKGFDILQTLENRFGEFIFSDAAIIASSSGSLKTVRLILERHPTREIPALQSQTPSLAVLSPTLLES